MNETQQVKSNIPTWISVQEACNLLNVKEKTIKNRCYKGDFIYKIEAKDNIKQIFIRYSSLSISKKINNGSDNKKYSEAPLWSRIQADKYIDVIKKSLCLRGRALKLFIENWNKNNPDNHTSYSSLIRMRNRYFASGINGLLSRYGNNSGRTIIEDCYFEYFKNLYLVEGAPSLRSCWEQTLGYAMRKYGISRYEFPCHATFKRRLEREVPEQSIYLARYGESAWNRKYGNYIDRDYSTVICGEAWVSDHAQIDVACLNSDGSVVFPWVTAWRDYKSGKWLGWILQCGHPNSDHIFQSFYYAVEKYGLPKDVIIDNGKDYRSKDFAGGRKFKIEADEFKTTCMLEELSAKQLEDMDKRLASISRYTNQMRPEIAEGLNVLVASGIDPTKALDYMNVIGRTATGEQAVIEDIARTAFSVTDNLKVPISDLGKSMDILAMSGKEGRFELKDI